MAKRNSFETKTNFVKQHLLSGMSITSWEAIELYKATRISAIIFNLKNIHNIPIETTMVHNDDGTRYAVYSIPKDYLNRIA